MIRKTIVSIWLLVAAFQNAAAEDVSIEERKVALVIGNSTYSHVPALSNPANDATDVAAALTRVGFEVMLGINQSDTQMRTALRDFSRAIGEATLSVVYFAGHGIEIDKSNYLIPVDAMLREVQDTNFETVSLDAIMKSLASAPGVKIVLLDACRDNPFAQRLKTREDTRSIGLGLVRVDAIGGILPGGIMVGYAAREGAVALDGTGRNSPYAQALLEHFEEPGLEVGKMFRRVRDRVFELTDGQQEPFTYGSLPGSDIYIAQAGDTAIPVHEDSALVAEFAMAEHVDDILVWEEFLGKYGTQPDHPLVKIALRRLTLLRARAKEIEKKQNSNIWLFPKSGRKTVPLNLTRQERQLVQTSLNYMGFDTGGVDGNFGPKTRDAIFQARKTAGLSPGTQVDSFLLRVLPNVMLVDDLRSDRARKYLASDLPETLEPRLRIALLKLDGFNVLFDYFEGRLYLAVIGSGFGSWNHKNAFAGKIGGHLATITSEKENRFLVDLVKKDPQFVHKDGSGSLHGPVFGLVQQEGSSEPGGGWKWVTGEAITFTKWARGKPDHGHFNQNFASFYARSGKLNDISSWDDTAGERPAFLVEVE